MLVKQLPSDFQVDECTDWVHEPSGEFAVYRLAKENYTTYDALTVVRKRWHTPVQRLSIGGLKDRHAKTTQYFTILHGPKQDLAQNGLAVTYLGQSLTPFESTDIRANRFTITLRAIAADAVSTLSARLDRLPDIRLPNYFDDQRFGSVVDGEFIARAMVLGEFEHALLLALVAPYEFDRHSMKQEKNVLRQHWGDWSRCLKSVRTPDTVHVLRSLLRGSDFRAACLQLPEDMLILYLHAWQSHLWNRCLDRWLRSASTRVEREVVLKTGTYALLGEEIWPEDVLPLPSARLKPTQQESWWPHLAATMAEAGVELSQMLIPGVRKPFFSKGERNTTFAVRNVASTITPDERHPGQMKLNVVFELPRGHYATIVLKYLGAENADGLQESP